MRYLEGGKEYPNGLPGGRGGLGRSCQLSFTKWAVMKGFWVLSILCFEFDLDLTRLGLFRPLVLDLMFASCLTFLTCPRCKPLQGWIWYFPSAFFEERGSTSICLRCIKIRRLHVVRCGDDHIGLLDHGPQLNTHIP